MRREEISCMKNYIKSENPVIISPNTQIADTNLVSIHTYSSGHSVPIFLVNNYYALNKMLGYAKYINGDFGTILYRGECFLHNTMIPSIHRGVISQKACHKADTRLNNIIKYCLEDKSFVKTIMTENQTYPRLVLEGLLQHYGVRTHFIDVVDNHWVALWFGLYNVEKIKSKMSYIIYTKRNVDVHANLSDEAMYQYMILIASNNSITNLNKIDNNKETVTIDLRANLPSTFLRPHAQHGIVIRRFDSQSCDYDISKYVVGILKIPIFLVEKWLGDGALLSVNNLFPSPAFDLGYDLLLDRTDLFSDYIHRIAY